MYFLVLNNFNFEKCVVQVSEITWWMLITLGKLLVICVDDPWKVGLEVFGDYMRNSVIGKLNSLEIWHTAEFWDSKMIVAQREVGKFW
jgi:hypothetical protein